MCRAPSGHFASAHINHHRFPVRVRARQRLVATASPAAEPRRASWCSFPSRMTTGGPCNLPAAYQSLNRKPGRRLCPAGAFHLAIAYRARSSRWYGQQADRGASMTDVGREPHAESATCADALSGTRNGYPAQADPVSLPSVTACSTIYGAASFLTLADSIILTGHTVQRGRSSALQTLRDYQHGIGSLVEFCRWPRTIS